MEFTTPDYAAIGDMRAVTCCFSGHRPGKLPWGRDENSREAAVVRLRLLSAAFEAHEAGYTRFISGMAAGVDLMAAETVIELRRTLPDIELECAVPYAAQDSSMSPADRERYRRILAQAQRRTLIAKEYAPYVMRARNRYMVDSSSLLIAVYDGQRGGTDMTIAYAKEKGLRIKLIDLRED